MCFFPPVCMHVSPPMLCCFLFTVATGILTDTHMHTCTQACTVLPVAAISTPSPDFSLWLFLSSLVSAARSQQPHLQTTVKTVTTSNVVYVTVVRAPDGLLTYIPRGNFSRGGQIFVLLLLWWVWKRTLK